MPRSSRLWNQETGNNKGTQRESLARPTVSSRKNTRPEEHRQAEEGVSFKTAVFRRARVPESNVCGDGGPAEP